MNKFEKTLLKHNIGYLDERDEYQQGVIYETLATANLYLSYLLIICMVISLIFDGINHSLTFGTFALAALQFGNSCYILNKLKKSGAYETEVYDDYTYNMEIKKLKKQCIISAIQWGIFMFFVMTYLWPWILGDPINVGLRQVIAWTIGVTLFGLLCYAISKSKIKKVV